MKEHKYYKVELTEEEQENFTDYWEDASQMLPDDPWRGTKEQLVEFIEEDVRGYQRKELSSILEKIKHLKDDDEILMVLGL